MASSWELRAVTGNYRQWLGIMVNIWELWVVDRNYDRNQVKELWVVARNYGQYLRIMV